VTAVAEPPEARDSAGILASLCFFGFGCMTLITEIMYRSTVTTDRRESEREAQLQRTTSEHTRRRGRDRERVVEHADEMSFAGRGVR
jgi:hypothetical protein